MYDEGDDAGRAVWESAVEDMVSVQSRPRARGTKGYRCPTSDTTDTWVGDLGAPVADGQASSVARTPELLVVARNESGMRGARRREVSLSPDSLVRCHFPNEAWVSSCAPRPEISEVSWLYLPGERVIDIKDGWLAVQPRLGGDMETGRTHSVWAAVFPSC